MFMTMNYLFSGSNYPLTALIKNTSSKKSV